MEFSAAKYAIFLILAILVGQAAAILSEDIALNFPSQLEEAMEEAAETPAPSPSPSPEDDPFHSDHFRHPKIPFPIPFPFPFPVPVPVPGPESSPKHHHHHHKPAPAPAAPTVPPVVPAPVIPAAPPVVPAPVIPAAPPVVPVPVIPAAPPVVPAPVVPAAPPVVPAPVIPAAPVVPAPVVPAAPPAAPAPAAPAVAPVAPAVAPRNHSRHHHHDFCSRAIHSKSCPVPHTRRQFDVEGYMGRWYEIGATAQYKFQYEAGLVCDHVLHNLLVRSHDDYGAVFALLNRGQPVLRPLQAAAVTKLSIAAQGVCKDAHAICNIVAPHELFTTALNKLSTTVHTIRNDSVMTSRHELANLLPSTRLLKSLARNITIVTNRLARDMTRLAYLNGNISQGLGHQDVNVDSLMELSSSLKDYISVLNLRISELAPNIKTELLRDAEFLRPESIPLSTDLADAILSVYVGLERVQARLVDITALVSGITTSARAYDRVAPPYNWNPLQYPVSEVRGVAVQNPDAAAKFVLSQHGFNVPYWVLDVETHNGTDATTDNGNGTRYDAALIYSCVETKDGPPNKQLFILSRNATLSQDTLTRFAATAEDHGIYTECDNPFIYAVQDRRICTSWPF